MTEPAYMREVRAGRWQNAANMSGMSIQYLRLTHDDVYRKAHAAMPKAEKATPEKPVLSGKQAMKLGTYEARDRAAASKTKRRGMAQEAKRIFAAAVKRRREALGWTLGDLADRVDLTYYALANALTPSGHMSPGLHGNILAALAQGESEEKIRQQELKGNP